MPGQLIIRNLTRETLTLKQADQFEVQKRSSSAKVFGSITSNFTSIRNDKDPATQSSEYSSAKRKKALYHEIDNSVLSSKQNKADISISPFTTHETSIATVGAEHKKVKVLRLAFESSDGARYRIDVPAPSDESQTLKPMNPSAGNRQYTAIFNVDTSTLALFDTSNLSRWMEAMPDHLPLSALSIPGTHNSPTCHSALPSVRCQAVSPSAQLENGVRFFDVRLQVEDPGKADSDALHLVHSAFPISLTGSKHFRDLLKDIYAFLEKHPSETLILCLKREGRGNGTDAQLADRLYDHYINERQWHTDSGVPTLGDVRGRIVLMRRFNLGDRLKKEFHGKGWGIDATNWADNTANHYGGDIQIQDFYEMTDTENIDKKIKLVCEHFERAGAVSASSTATGMQQQRKANPLFINFLSASNFFKPGCWPERIAAKLNPAILAFLCEAHDVKDEEKGDGCTGVVVCDWVGEDGDWDLVRAIVGMNSRILMKEERGLEDEDGESGEDDEHTGPATRGTRRGRGGRGVGRARGRGRERGRGAHNELVNDTLHC